MMGGTGIEREHEREGYFCC